jgi:ferredoxin--NADP+ reductase
MPYVITELCTLDGSCVDVCPVSCIHTKPGLPQYYIDPDVCIECEQCQIVCPVEAIAVDWKLPEEYLGAIEVNAAFFRHNKAAPESVSLELAYQMVHAVEAYAAELAMSVSVAVVDRMGAPLAVSRMDGASPWTPELALNKAHTAVSFWLATHLMRAEGRRPWFRSLVVSSRGRIMQGGGGVPVVENAYVIGAVGVAGSDTEEQDVRCCQAALGVIQGHGH